MKMMMSSVLIQVRDTFNSESLRIEIETLENEQVEEKRNPCF